MTSVGTDGDIYPFFALGAELCRRGHRVTLATHEHFAPYAHSAGLDFRCMVFQGETEQLLRQRDFWHPYKSALVLARWGGPLIERQYAVLKELASGNNTMLVASPGVLAARLVQEVAHVPLCSVVLQPWLIPSVHQPPVMMGGLGLPRWAPRPIGALYLRLFDQVGALLLGRQFRSLRAALGLKPLHRMFRWWFSPDLVLGFFPEWFAPPQPDWPAQTRLVGFPLVDGRPASALPETVARFCAAGQPPIAFTFGTGMLHAAALFREAIEACRLLRARAVFLSEFPAQLPQQLPDHVTHCNFAPFEDLFLLCAAVVHHGGIGTVAKALAAGRPQLILPFAYDQMDNALRVESLGAGDWLKPNRRNARQLASALARVMAPESADSARRAAARLQTRSGLVCAAELIEALQITA